jgi:hypothetical protein
MKRRWKILIGLGILLVLLCASLFVSQHVQPANEVEAYKKLLRAKGEKLDWAELVTRPASAENNSADAVQKALATFDSGSELMPYAMQSVGPGRALVGWQQPDARNSDFTNSWEEYAAKVAGDRPTLALLGEVLQRPKLEFPFEEQNASVTLFTNLFNMKRAAQKLDATAIFELHGGDADAAATNILTILALVQKNAAQGVDISHLVRLSMANLAEAPTWELLQATNVADPPLAAVEKAWQQMDFLQDAENSLTWERAWASAQTVASRQSHAGFTNLFGDWIDMGGSGGGSGTGWAWPDLLDDATSGSRGAISETLWRSSWSYESELYALKTAQILLETVRAMRTNRSRFYQVDFNASTVRLGLLTPTNSGTTVLDVLKIPDLRRYFEDSSPNSVLRRTLQAEAGRNVVISAIALKRFQLKQGRLPDTLAELAPDYLPAVPIDPYDGKPLKYHPNYDGTYLLYSVGEDGVDDGGDASLPSGKTGSWYWLRGRDWVWPQPASPADVENFYAHPPK